MIHYVPQPRSRQGGPWPAAMGLKPGHFSAQTLGSVPAAPPAETLNPETSLSPPISQPNLPASPSLSPNPVAPQSELGLAAEHGFYYKEPAAAEWEARFGEHDEHAGWKEMTLPILQLYTESTDGSNIEAKDSALVRPIGLHSWGDCQCDLKPKSVSGGELPSQHGDR